MTEYEWPCICVTDFVFEIIKSKIVLMMIGFQCWFIVVIAEHFEIYLRMNIEYWVCCFCVYIYIFDKYNKRYQGHAHRLRIERVSPTENRWTRTFRASHTNAFWAFLLCTYFLACCWVLIILVLELILIVLIWGIFFVFQNKLLFSSSKDY